MTALIWKIARIWSELRRRHVVRVALIYIVVGAGLVEFSATVFPRLGLEDWVISLVLLLVAIGLPLALIAAWALELSPDGELKLAEAAASPRGVEAPERPSSGEGVSEVAVQSAAGRADRKLSYVGLGILIGLFTVGAYAVTSGPDAEVPASSIRSVAVLPFSDRSAGGGQAYLGAGVAEELLDALAQVRGLKVAARSSSFLFAAGGTDVREIGDRLDVQAVLEGSIARDGDRLRVRAQLVDTGEGFQLWSATYDRDVMDLLALQTEIARTIVDTLEIRFRARGGRPQPVDPTAYELYLRARHIGGSRLPEDLREAESLYREALVLDPHLARAAASLSWTRALRLAYAEAGQEVTAESVLQDADAAIGVDPSIAQAHVARGMALAGLGRDREAAEAFRSATMYNPNSAPAHHAYAQLLERNGDPEGAAAARAAAESLDPASSRSAPSREEPRPLPPLPGT